MRCPYCGDRRTELLNAVYRGHSSYRHRRRLYCGSASVHERGQYAGAALIGSGRAPALCGRDGGIGRRQLCGESVRLSRCGVDFKRAGIRRHVDHIVPTRLIRRLKAGNPDRRENLQWYLRNLQWLQPSD
jgi:hypothetical protein